MSVMHTALCFLPLSHYLGRERERKRKATGQLSSGSGCVMFVCLASAYPCILVLCRSLEGSGLIKMYNCLPYLNEYVI